MPTVRRRYHYGHVLLNPNVVGKNKALCGSSVRVIDKLGCHFLVPLQGFYHLHNNTSVINQNVDICDIDAYTDGDPLFGNWIDYGNNVLMQGHLYRGGAYLHLSENKPIAYCSLLQVNQPPRVNNVVSIYDK